MKVQVEVVAANRDSRGLVFEPVHGEQLAFQQNVHVVFTQPGQVRGNHYHRHGTEVLVVLGPALVRLREENAVRDYAVPEGEIIRFVLPPGTPHAIRNTGSTPGVLVGFNTFAHDPEHPDTFREVLI